MADGCINTHMALLLGAPPLHIFSYNEQLSNPYLFGDENNCEKYS